MELHGGGFEKLTPFDPLRFPIFGDIRFLEKTTLSLKQKQ